MVEVDRLVAVGRAGGRVGGGGVGGVGGVGGRDVCGGVRAVWWVVLVRRGAWGGAGGVGWVYGRGRGKGDGRGRPCGIAPAPPYLPP